MKILLLIFILAYSAISFSAIPEYSAPVIIARADINNSYNIPSMSFINNSSPVINDRGDVAFKVAGIGAQGLQGLWVKLLEDENGKILYIAPSNRMMSEPSINDQGKIAFNLFEDGVTDGLFTFDAKSLAVENVLPSTNLHLQNFTYPLITNNDEIFFRGTDDNNLRSFFHFDSQLSNVISEGNNTSYLFRPAVNDEGTLAFKMRIGELGQWDENAPDRIILLQNNIKKIIAEDRDSNPHSIFLGFFNYVSLSTSDLVAFTGIVENNQRGIFINSNGETKQIAIEGKDNILEIENFPAKINDEGQVVFRAKDISGKRSIYLANSTEVKKLISEGDEIDSDLGKSKILLNQFYPGFGGELAINLQGDIVFNCSLVRANDDHEIGQAIYKMSVKK